MAVLIQREPWHRLGMGRQRHPPPALHPGKITGTYCTRGWVGLGTVRTGKENFSSLGFELRIFQHVAGRSINCGISAA
jgi:hypothetical protein